MVSHKYMCCESLSSSPYLAHILIGLESGCQGGLLCAQCIPAHSAQYQADTSPSTDLKQPTSRCQATSHKMQGVLRACLAHAVKALAERAHMSLCRQRQALIATSGPHLALSHTACQSVRWHSQGLEPPQIGVAHRDSGQGSLFSGNRRALERFALTWHFGTLLRHPRAGCCGWPAAASASSLPCKRGI